MKWEYGTPGIPEDLFVRGNVPITKNEVRVISLSKLRLKDNQNLLDVGCGTGSVTVEMALQCRRGKVISIDKNQEAVELTKKNVERFSLKNVDVIQGEAPKDLPKMLFDRIFIGGASKEIEALLQYTKEHLTEGGIVVSNTILLESTYRTLKALEQQSFRNIDCICLNVSKAKKISGWMMKALNPIYIISAEK